MDLRTERLLLRPFTPGDLDALYGWRSDPEVTRFLLSGPTDREGAQEMLDQRLRQATLPTAEGQGICFAVQLHAGGTVVGEVNLDLTSEENSCGEIGYVIAKEHSGKGYASEAAAALLALGFRNMKLHRIIARSYAQHAASHRVMERIGMRKEAHFVEDEFLKGEWTSQAVHAILAREWHG